ncbi:MAG: hypothetical protein ACTIJ9_11140 [Aequorivita sp.]
MLQVIVSISLLATLFCSAQQIPNSLNDSIQKSSKISVTPVLTSEVKTEIIDSTYIIPDNPQEVYRGIYKENKPYNGYFKVGDSEIFWVDFYNDGEKTNQYSFDIIKNIEGEEQKEREEINYDYLESGKTVLDIKSTFKNGEIVDGEILGSIKDGYFAKKYNNGKIVEVKIDVFAMHYANRLTFKVTENKILFSHLKDRASIVRFSVNNGRLLVEVVTNDTIIASNNLNDCNPKNPKPNSNIRIFKIKDRIDCLIFKNDLDLKIYEDNLSMLQNIILSNYTFPSDSNDPYDFLKQFLEKLSSEEEEIKKEDPLSIAFLDTDKNGIIKEGIYWEEATNNNGSYKIYKDGKRIKEAENNLLDFQNTLEDYFKQDY